jgi:hypothetical protein
MIAALFLCCVVLVIVATMFALAFTRERAVAHANRADAERLQYAFRNNLRSVRAHVGHLSQEAIAVCDALETTLRERCRVDHDVLERRIMALRQERNTTLKDANAFDAGKAEALRLAHHAIERQIVPGELTAAGVAERNGLIAAANTIERMAKGGVM